jgi:hypothetical protein
MSDADTCPAGSYFHRTGGGEGVEEGKVCIPCQPGTYQPQPNSWSCLECKRGTYSTGVAVVSAWGCKNCPSGKYAVNSSFCRDCPVFTTSPQGAFSSMECKSKAGYYSPKGGEGVECPANHFCPSGTNKPSRCPHGMSSKRGSSGCLPVWKDIRVYNWVFASVWITLFLLSLGWLGFHQSNEAAKNSSIPKEHEEIMIKVVR